MIHIAPIFSSALMQGKSLFFSTLAMLEFAGVSLVPETDKLHESEHSDVDETDLYAAQWASLWSSMTRVKSARLPVTRNARILAAQAQKSALSCVQVADLKLLSHSLLSSSVSRMLSCQRKLGDPANAAPSYYVVKIVFYSRSTFSNSLSTSLIHIIISPLQTVRLRFTACSTFAFLRPP